ncbi:MAG TPA: hypothetical protein VJV79_07210 [Polyangiaceae bacterium]|nr:hypothetical protein [Polyangiaceae bacterium]
MARKRTGRSTKPVERDVVKERRELRLPVLRCCLTYTVEGAVRDYPALCPDRVSHEIPRPWQSFTLSRSV